MLSRADGKQERKEGSHKLHFLALAHECSWECQAISSSSLAKDQFRI